MASYLENLVLTRDAMAAELAAEMARRAALVAAGHPPPISGSFGGKSVSWTEYVTSMQKAIADMNALIVATGAEGIAEIWVRAY